MQSVPNLPGICFTSKARRTAKIAWHARGWNFEASVFPFASRSTHQLAAVIGIQSGCGWMLLGLGRLAGEPWISWFTSIGHSTESHREERNMT